MSVSLTIHDIFKTQGQPTITYVKRQDGIFEKKLADALASKGVICLLTGSSKTGKTTLYTNLASEKHMELLRVRCDSSLSATDLWRKALENVNFDQVSEHQKHKQREISAKGKISGGFGLPLLGGIRGETGTGISSTSEETEIRKTILANPSPDHLIPILQNSQIMLVVEDFHYLRPDVQKNVFQQWKAFVDSEVSVIIVGTTHHAVDLAYANRDLIGRIVHITLPAWEPADLKKIASQGFGHLKIPLLKDICDVIANESVGLPIITQSTCLQMLLNENVHNLESDHSNVGISEKDAYAAFHQVAVQKFNQFSAIYDRLTRGPRQKARRYNTYEFVLSTFALDPVTSSLHRDDIDKRLRQLPIKDAEVPPPQSVDSMLTALASFQDKLGIELLEWNERNQRLFILEPSFLFYLRWRKERQKSPSMKEILTEILLSKIGEVLVKEE